MPLTSRKPSSSKASSTKIIKKKQPPHPPLPWPLLKPLVPTSSLSLDILLPSQIVLIHNLFTATLCRDLVSFLSKLPLTTTPGKPKKDEALRVNDRLEIDDPVFVERLWKETGLERLVMGKMGDGDVDHDENVGMGMEERRELWGGDVLGLNPRVRVYRYGEGQFFGKHYDESNTILLPTSPPSPAKTTWTLLIYLTGPATGCVGGETIFYPELGQAKTFSGAPSDSTEPLAVGLEVGMGLLHRHGNDCMLHEGSEVREGEKWIIRSDLCIRR